MFADTVSDVVASAQQGGTGHLAGIEAAKMDVVLQKAVRARRVLQQLQDFSNKQQQLELQYRPVVAQLPALLEQLRPEELSQAAEFAALEGMREPLLQASGSTSAAMTSTAAQATDPFGIRIAFRPGHPLSLLTWGQYLATVSRMSRTVEQQLQHHDWTALAAFNSERRQLVHELQALRQQLEPEVDIPQLQPLRDEVERLDHLLVALHQLQDAHLAMLRKDMSLLDLQLLELKLKLKMGEGYSGSDVQAAVSRLKQLHAKVQEGTWLPAAAWTQLGEDLKTLIGHAQQQQKLQQLVEVNIQKHEQAMFRKRGLLPSRAVRVGE